MSDTEQQKNEPDESPAADVASEPTEPAEAFSTELVLWLGGCPRTEFWKISRVKSGN